MTQRRPFRSMAIGLALLVPTTQTGCGRTGWELFGAGLQVAVALAEVYAAVATVAAHDGHHHSWRCGHPRAVWQDRVVYAYEGRWEYYDEATGTWYWLPEGLPEE